MKTRSFKLTKSAVFVMAFVMLTLLFTMYQTSANPVVQSTLNEIGIDESSTVLETITIPTSAEAATTISNFGTIDMDGSLSHSTNSFQLGQQNLSKTLSTVTLNNKDIIRATYGGAVGFSISAYHAQSNWDTGSLTCEVNGTTTDSTITTGTASTSANYNSSSTTYYSGNVILRATNFTKFFTGSISGQRYTPLPYHQGSK